jgi:hypothetical protein
MYTWLIQITTEYKYSPAMVLSYQNGENINLEQAMVPLIILQISL